MTALKVIANTLLSLLLFLCLILTGIAVTLNATVFNAGFVTGQINRLDAVALFNEEILPELQQDETWNDYPGFTGSLQSAVENNTLALKNAVNLAVKDIYGYVLGNRPLDLRETLKNSLMEPGLAAGILQDIDISLVVPDLLKEAASFESIEIAGSSIDLSPYMEEAAAAVEPAIKAQLIDHIPALYAYLLGESQSLDIGISLSSLITDIGAALKENMLDSPPSSLSSMPHDELSAAFDAAWEYEQTQIPASIHIDAEEMGIARVDEISQALNDAEIALAEAREWAGYYRLSFWGLILLTLLVAGLIILVNRDMKINCRLIGGLLVTYGLGEAIAILVSRGFIHSRILETLEAPASLSPWIVQISDAVTNPLLVFALCCTAAGIILFVVSYFYHRTPAAS